MLKSEKIAYKLIEILFRVIGCLPRKWSFKLGSFWGHFLFLIDRKHQTIVSDNLKRAFGNEKSRYEIRRLGKQVFVNTFQMVLDIGWSLGLNKQQLKKYFKIEGRSYIEKASAKGKGILVLAAHFGNWELLTVVGAMLGIPLTVLYRPLDYKPFDSFFFNLRTRFGARAIPLKRSLLAILRSLERGEMVALLMDQNVDWYEGVFVDFMGHRACTNKGLAMLALKTGAPVIPVFMIREKEGFIAKFLPEVPLQQTGDKTKDLENNTRQYNKIIESFLHQYPDQWFWLHQRWKTKPYQPWPRETV